MLQIADVNKLKCKFVTEWVKFLQRRKYVIGYCYDDIYKYLEYYKLATSLSECLEYEDECELTKLATLLPDEPNDGTITLNCADQLQLSLSSTPKVCTYTPSASIDGQSKMKFTIKNNSILHDRTVNLTVLNGCNNQTTIDEVYTDSVTYFETGYTLTGAKTMTNGYMKQVLLYKTDATATLTPIYIDTSPTSSYLTGAAGTVLSADLYFSSSNYATAVSTLLKNAIASNYGLITYIEPNIRFDVSGNLYFFTKVKHDPSSTWVGVNTSNGSHEFTYSNSGKDFTVANIVSSYTNASIVNYNWNYTTPCSSTNPANLNSNGQLIFPLVSVNFHFVTLTSGPYSTNPVYVNNTSVNCTTYSLLATITTTETIISKTWYYGELVISSTDKITVIDPGDYTFQVILDSGCIYYETISIP